jgi:SAM-dependent methyltransferase
VSRLTRHWHRLNDRTIGGDGYWWIALQNAVVYTDTQRVAARHVRGRTLDAGAGRLAWRPLLRRYSRTYVSGDLTPEHPEVDVLFDVTRPFPFPAESFDTVFCHSVLEHTREPWRAMPEMWRVLAPGGRAIVAVPFVFYLHGQPHDYYRFSRYGLAYLAQQAGFEVIETVANGGIVHLLLNIPSVLLSTLLEALGLRRWIPAVTRFWLALARRLARLDRSHLFTMNYIVVLHKAHGSVPNHAGHADDRHDVKPDSQVIIGR